MKKKTKPDHVGKILPERPTFVYLGAPIFEDALRSQDVTLISTRWQPPREGSTEIDALLEKYL
jgi:hypothetical protein